MMKFSMDSSIQSILLRTLTVFSALIVLVVSLVLYGHFSRETNEMILEDSQLLVKKASESLESYIESTNQLFYMINHRLEESENLNNGQLLNDVENLLFARKDIVSVSLIDTTGNMVFGLPNVNLKETADPLSEDWYKSAMSRMDYIQISQPHVLNMYYEQFPWVVSFSKAVKLVKQGEVIEGVLVLHVNFNQIESLVKHITNGTRGYLYIIEESGGNVVYHPRLELVYTKVIEENVELALRHSYGSYIYKDADKQEKIMSIQTISNVGWKVVGVIDVESTILGKKSLKEPMISLGIAFVLIVVVISSVIARWISNPIRGLARKMKDIGYSNLGEKVEIQTSPYDPREIRHLSLQFTSMMSTISDLMAKVVKEQDLKRKHELDALQAQINPHFLYNTLDMLVSMVGVNKNDEVIKTIAALSRLFRISIGKGKAETTIREELEHVRNYLLIQHIRFKDKFDYMIEMDEEVANFMTLKLIIQPIVENAIKHGFELAVDKGLIRITAKLIDGQVVFTVEDNGLGMSEERLQQIRSGLYESKTGTGVGVYNVQNRIHLYYGDQYNLQFESEIEEGTRVTIPIPVIENPKRALTNQEGNK